MADSLRIVRIFIGSPGGLDEERQAAHDVVNSVNRSHSERWGILFKLFGWEDALPGYVRPQSKINEDLDRCDYFIGVLWNHWGSRPSLEQSGPSSGFEEEYCRAESRIQSRLMRDMALYFKAVEIPTGMEPGESIRRVLDFKQKCIDEKKIFFKEFSEVHSFKDAVREKLEEIGWREADELSGGNSPDQPEQSAATSGGPTDAVEGWLLDEHARTFLADFASRPTTSGSTSPQAVARLRLIASSVSRSGNDELYLGPHDANIFFQYYRNQVISDQEITALIDCGVTGYEHQNVPLWCWLAKTSDDDYLQRVKVLAVSGTDTERKSAIGLLKVTGQTIPEQGGVFSKAHSLNTWLSDGTSKQVFEAAVDFLAANVDSPDLPLIEEIGAMSSVARRGRLNEAIVAITARHSLDAALNVLLEKNVARLDERLTSRLFAHPHLLPTETLVACLAAKPDRVRLNALRLLFDRREVQLETAKSLLTDSNYEIRLLASEILISLGVHLSDSVATSALKSVKTRQNSLVDLFSGSETDDTFYNKYIDNRLAQLDFSTLSRRVDEAGVFDQGELAALYKKYPAKTAPNIRSNLQDSFKSHFESKLRDAR